MKGLVCIISLLLLASGIWAGDIGIFKNLGFSPDSRYFQFGVYGIDSKTQNPYAETYIVDVPRNDFVKSGVARSVYSVGTTLGDDGMKALLAHLDKTAPARKSFKIDPLIQGRPVYFRVTNENTPADNDTVQVLDYATENEYTVKLNKDITKDPAGSVTSSTFSLDVTIRDKQGNLKGPFSVGHPHFSRPGVSNYTLVQMILTPNARAMVFVLEKELANGASGADVRPMVETLIF